MSLQLHPLLPADAPAAGQPFVVSLPLSVQAPLVFAPDLQLVLEEAGSGAVAWIGRLGEEVRIPWLPRGTWFVRWMTSSLALAAGRYRIRAVAVGAHGERTENSVEFELVGAMDGGALTGAWQVEAADGTVPLEQLAWRHHGHPFEQRFDDVPALLIERILGPDAGLNGRLIEIGCGDGALALGLALRCRPQRFLAMDASARWTNLIPRLAEQGIPADALPPTLEFRDGDGSNVAEADGAFDLALIWDGLVALDQRGHAMLAEVARTLACGGLLCLRSLAGEAPFSAVEAALRGLGLVPRRVLSRCRDCVEVDVDVAHRPLSDLALSEVISLWHKPHE